MKKSIIVALVIVVAAALVAIFGYGSKNEARADVKNIPYTIGSDVFELKNGIASKEAAPGSATMNTLRMFGEPVYGDLDGNGDATDAAIMLEHNPGGSGTFYYAVLAMNAEEGYRATNALLLGDRIAPQTVNIQDGRAVFNYAERKAGEPMTADPSVGKSLWIHFDKASGTIGEWVKDFEGEANPAVMKLEMKKWVWVKAQLAASKEMLPKKPNVFTLTFSADGNVAVGTDCNSMSGNYTVKDKKLTFGSMATTLMYCEGSQEQEFSALLGKTESYRFTSKGELILTLTDSGTMTFR